MANCNPVPCGCSETDILTFQFSEKDPFNDWKNGLVTHGWSATQTGDWFATVVIQSSLCCTAVYEDFVKAAEVDWEAETGQTYQMIQIDPTTLPDEFFIQFIFRNADGSTRNVFTSQEYRKVKCNVPTIKLKGIYSKKDCKGNKYDAMTDVFSAYDPITYIKELRLEGTLTSKGYQNTYERSNKNYNVNNTTSEIFELSLALVPPEIADEINTILLAKWLYVNDVLYRVNDSLEKNNGIGTMFDIKLDLLTYECEIQHEC